MKTPTLKIQNLGQIKEANLSFGDLTVLVGPQATGKSIALQLLKLMVDAGQVQDEMGRYGIDWSGKLPDFIDAYFGEGMHSIWKHGQSTVTWSGKAVDLVQIAKRKRTGKDENLFFIPAQRVLALRDGWPRPFTDYSPGDPFAVREFSEKLRVLVEKEFGGESLFPQPKRLKKEFRDLLERDVFSKFSLKVDKVRSQKRLVLGNGKDDESLPYMVWSAGQREFVPLLLGFYWLMPPTAVSRRGDIEWVVLEELEMGLHPKAISVVLLMVFELLARGYRVCLSTHSSQVLDAMWALKHLRENNAKPEVLLDVFDAPKGQAMIRMAEAVMGKTSRVHYFDRQSGCTRDISSLDPGAEEAGEAGWGGLSEFSGRANDAVARAVANPNR
ncbi:MAG: ATP-binding protein [Verrucomicrobiaceae bacterium]|nr:ATP-binding protein [Verrucomicrobiaceae bacterium]